MFKRYYRELMLAALLTLGAFALGDVLGDFIAPQGDGVRLSPVLMIFSMIMLVSPGLIGSIPSGYMIAKKTKNFKAHLFVPAVGTAIGGIIIMALAGIALLLIPDVAWVAQMNNATEMGIDLFSQMSLADYKAMIMFSVIFGALFLAILNFTIGLAGGFIGSKIAEMNEPEEKAKKPKKSSKKKAVKKKPANKKSKRKK